MSKKVFQLVTGVVLGLGTIASSCATFFIEDNQLATAVVSSIGVVVTAVDDAPESK